LKYYVNLKYNAKENYGKFMHLEAKASGLSEDDLAITEWWVEPGPDNVDLKYLARNSRARLKKKYSINKKDKFYNSLYLPHVGGDEYTVKCSKKDDRSNPLLVEKIETWRKVFYTVYCMGSKNSSLFGGVKGNFEEAFKECKVEMELANKTSTKKDEPYTNSKNVEKLYSRKKKLKNKPFHLRIVVLNSVYDIIKSRYKQDFSGVNTTKGYINTYYVLSTETKTHWYVSSQARVAGSNNWISIKSISKKSGDRQIEIDFSKNKTLQKGLSDGKKIEVRYKVREFEDFLGFSHGNLCVVGTDDKGKSEAKIKETVLQTFTHEVGHGLQQVIKDEDLFKPDGKRNGIEKNDKWHTDNYGGQGPHCKTNAKLVADTRTKEEGQTTSKKVYAHDSGILCTMFYRDDGAVDKQGKFCESCKPRLIRTNLSIKKMNSNGWNWY